MKKLILCLMLLGTFACCSSDDHNEPNPTISGVEIDSPSKDDPLKISVGETITFTVKSEDTDKRFYKWYVNDVVKSEEAKFAFKPEAKGEYKVKVEILNAQSIATIKEVGVVTASAPKPSIAALTYNGKEVDGEINISTKDKMKFAVDAINAEGATYYWILNGDTLKDANTSTLEYDLGLSGTLKVSVENADKVGDTQEVKLTGLFRKGTFFFGTTSEGLTFVDEAGKEYKDNIYEEVNGEIIGDGGINDLYIHNNKLYLLTPTSKTKKAQVVIADAQTLKKISVITADGFNTASLGQIYNLMVVSDTVAYIGYNNSVKGNKSGVRVLDMKAKTIASEDITGTSGALGVDGPAWSRMLKSNESIVVACGSKVKFINVKTNKIDESKSIELHKNRQVIDIVKGNDKNIYALVNGQVDKSGPYWLWGSAATSPASVLAIDATTLGKGAETILKLNDTNVALAGGLGNSKACTSPNSDVIYFLTEAGYSGPKEIHQYNYKTNKTSVFTDISQATGLSGNMMNGYLGVDAQGMLYASFSNYSSTSIGTFDTKTSKQDVNKIYHVNGEGNAAPTWMFQ